MKLLRPIVFAAACVLSLSLYAGAGRTPARAAGDNRFICVKDFYDSNKNRDWWDRGVNSLVADGGGVEYLEDDRYMEVDFRGRASQPVMWGVDDVQIPREERDWSEAKFLVSEVKNLLTSPAKYSIIVSTGKNDANVYISEGATYYLKEPGAEAREYSFKEGFLLPAGFEGYVAVPTSSFAAANFSKTIRLSYQFFNGTACKLRLGRIGYAVSERFLSAEEFEVVDRTVYGIPDVPPFEKAPLRPSTEPASSQNNRYE